MTQFEPLRWPLQQPRTPPALRKVNPGWRDLTITQAVRQIELECRRLGGFDLVITSNLALYVSGQPRGAQPKLTDPAVAIYFARGLLTEAQQVVFACDKWARVEHNLRAISTHLDALRGQERWGVGTLDQAFAGYTALPEAAGQHPWWCLLGLPGPQASEQQIRDAYRSAARTAHPDAGGSHERFVALGRALEEGLQEVGRG